MSASSTSNTVGNGSAAASSNAFLYSTESVAVSLSLLSEVQLETALTTAASAAKSDSFGPFSAVSLPSSLSSLSARSAISVWLDCDPGHDDALAIVLSSHSSVLNLLGISTVAGNQLLEKVTNNACNMAYACGLTNANANVDVNVDVADPLCFPVVAGCRFPLLRQSHMCAEIHGESGLEGYQFPKHSFGPIQGQKFFNYMFNTFKQHFHKSGQKVVVIATGPLTNIATLLITYPEIVEYVEKLVLMGGAITKGNATAAAEFNIWVDAQAASIVFDSALEVVMVPLEVTHSALVTPQIIQKIESHATPFSNLIRDLLLFFAKTYKDVFGFAHPPLHDPCAVFYVICPQAFQCIESFVYIHCNEESPLYGATLCDLEDKRKSQRMINAASKTKTKICVRMDIQAFWTEMLNAIQAVNAHTPINQREK